MRRAGIIIAIAIGSVACGSESKTSGSGSSSSGGGGGAGGAATMPTGSPLALSAASLASCVVYDSGQLWCWGWNQNGQLGSEKDTQFEIPTHIAELGSVQAMAPSGDFGCAALGNGSVRCMGYDHGGTDQTVAVTNAVAVATGYFHACALTAGGDVLCWGQNDDGQLGDGSEQGRTEPAPVDGLSDVQAIAAAGSRTCAIDGAGTVYCWGDRLDGGAVQLSPEAVVGIGEAVAVDMSDDQTCVLLGAGTVSCWGSGACAALGADSCDAPVAVPSQDVVAIAVGSSFGCYVSGGELSCWGRNSSGQLGDGTQADTTAPQVVDGLGSMSAVAAGDSHVCAASNDGTVHCWGSNGNGQIGNGNTIEQLTPFDVGL